MKNSKSLFGAGILLFIFLYATGISAQTTEKIVEKRAREMHRNFTQSNEKAWESFILNNYSRKFLEKYDVSRHMEMFRRLNKDFSNSEVKTIKVTKDNVHMSIVRTRDNHVVTFDFSYDQTDSYKFNGFSIEAGEL